MNRVVITTTLQYKQRSPKLSYKVILHLYICAVWLQRVYSPNLDKLGSHQDHCWDLRVHVSLLNPFVLPQSPLRQPLTDYQLEMSLWMCL